MRSQGCCHVRSVSSLTSPSARVHGVGEADGMTTWYRLQFFRVGVVSIISVGLSVLAVTDGLETFAWSPADLSFIYDFLLPQHASSLGVTRPHTRAEQAHRSK